MTPSSDQNVQTDGTLIQRPPELAPKSTSDDDQGVRGVSRDGVGDDQKLTLEVGGSYVTVGATEDRNNPTGESLQSLRFGRMFMALSSPLPLS